MLEAGSILGGRYRVGRLLGKGGMGIVVEAMHVQLGTHVAVKVLRADYAEDPALVERFLREARAAARLRGEHICRVQDFGTLEDGAPFMVMELLQGRDLASVLYNHGPLDVAIVASYIMQACTGIVEAHAIGMVHRDLKPANLYLVQRLDRSPAIKILDFGLAKSVAQIDVSLTATSNVMGSPAYMSPEQLKSSKNVDPRSDIWALGVTMFELVSGDHPFTGETPTALGINISTVAPAALPSTLPSGFVDVILRCLEKDPAQRFPDVAELAAALAPFATADAAELASVAAGVLIGATADAGSVKTTPSVNTTLRHATGEVGARSRPTVWLALALVVAVGAAALALVVLGGKQRDEPVVQPAPAVAPPRLPAAVPPPIDAAVDAPVVDAAPPVDAALPRHHPATTPPSHPKDPGASRY